MTGSRAREKWKASEFEARRTTQPILKAGKETLKIFFQHLRGGKAGAASVIGARFLMESYLDGDEAN